MTKKRLINYIKKNRLICIVKANTTSRTLHSDWYLNINNRLEFVGGYKSSAIGMNRVFDCYCGMLRDYNIEEADLGEYKQKYNQYW